MFVNPAEISSRLEFHMNEGKITLYGNRMLLFHAEALGNLRQELVQSLGVELARGVLARFGYRCGYRDFFSVQYSLGLAPDDPELILAGPKMHTAEGVVLAECCELQFDHKSGSFFMQGTWRNSYEAEQHVRLFGVGKAPVCWTLTGYASGYATGFMGREIVAIERRCVGRGDPYCQYELRPAEEWGPEAREYIEALKPIAIVKSLQRMIGEEKRRALQWRSLSEVAAETLYLGNPEELAGKFVRYAIRVLEVEQAVLVLTAAAGSEKEYLVYKAAGTGELVTSETLASLDGTLDLLFRSEKVVEGEGRHWQGLSPFPKGDAGHYLAVPIRGREGPRGVLIVSDRQGGEAFTPEDRELLLIFASLLGIALANATLYSQTGAKLQEKVVQLDALTRELRSQHLALQRSVAIHDALTALVLRGEGVGAIARSLARIIGNPVRVEDAEGRRILAEAGLEERLPLDGFLSVQDLLTTAEPEVRSALLGEKRAVSLPGREVNGSRFTQKVVPVVAGEEMLAFINVLELSRPLAELDLIAVEHASTVVALELLKERAALETELRLKKDFLDQLLAGRYLSEESALFQAQAFGLNLSRPWRIMLLEFDGLALSELRRWQERASDLFCRELAPAIAASQEQGLLVLAQVEGKPIRELLKELAGKLGRILPETPWWLAVGPEGQAAGECRHAYLEAQAVMQVLKALGGRKRLLFHEDLTVFGLLQIDRDRFARFSQKVLGPLLEKDAKYRGQLLETLRLYFEHKGNVLKAAKSGFLSPGTIRYRLRRIEEICGFRLDDPETALQVQLALKIIL